MGRLRLKLLGGFEARIVSGPVLDIAARKTRALLAYLALPTGRTHSRDKLVGLLWSDRGDEQARNSLRQALTELGKALGAVGPSPLVKQRDSLALDPTTVEVDALEFENFAASNANSDLQRAAELYTGDLLDGFDARDAAFEEWLTVERQRMRTLAATVLKKLLTQETGPNAIAVAHRLLALDPLQEEGHRALMRLHAEAGETSTALQQYERCREILKSELTVVPSPETTALYQSIREQSVAPATQQPESRNASNVDNVSEAHRDQEAAKPSIAVLPFTNMSGDPEREYFSDGITDDIITELSRFRSLFVIARNSSFQYKGKNVDVRRVGRELGVQYIVEGSIRKAGNNVRITAQLIEAATGNHLWAERYDRDIQDIFDVQDEVVQAIVAVLPGIIEEAGARLARRKRPESLAAYDYLLRGIKLGLTFADSDTEAARKMFEEAIALDATIAPAYAWLAVLRLRDWWFNRSVQSVDEAFSLAKKAVATDGNDGLCHGVLGMVYLERCSFDEATFHTERFVALNPNDPLANVYKGYLLAYLGRAQEGVTWIERAFRLNPLAPQAYNSFYGMILFAARRYAESIAAFSRIILEPAEGGWDFIYLVAAHAYLGRLEDARTLINKWGTLHPGVSLLALAAKEPFKHPADLDHLLDGLRRAGQSK